MKRSLPTVSVVVLNWNGAAYLERCLRTLVNQTTLALQEIIVVDNASTDHSCDLVRTEFPSVRLVISSVNRGFAGGNNLGLQHARGDIVFFLNNDTEVDPHCVSAVAHAFTTDARVAVVGCVVKDLTHREEVQEAGMSIDRFGFPIPFALRRADLPPFYVSGCALAVRRSVAEELGLFDERYFIFAEDLDLCWRYRLAGLRVSVAGNAIVYHQGGGTMVGGVSRDSTPYTTSLKRIYLRERNTIATLIKNYEILSLFRIIPAYVALLIGELMIALLMFRFRLAYQYLRAISWNIRHLSETLHRRSRVQSIRRVPDGHLAFDQRIGKWVAVRSIGVPRLAK